MLYLSSQVPGYVHLSFIEFPWVLTAFHIGFCDYSAEIYELQVLEPMFYSFMRSASHFLQTNLSPITAKRLLARLAMIATGRSAS